MLHLPAERLAALATEAPTADEAEHLGACPACARERDAHRALLGLATAGDGAPMLPLTRWPELAARLRDEGLVRQAPRWRGTALRWSARAAAALLLAGGGLALGRWSAGASPLSLHRPATLAAAPAVGTPALLAAAADSAPAFHSTAEATLALDRYEHAYQIAASYLASHDSAWQAGEDPATYRTRLAALDQVAQTTRQALREAPYDPVINRYYLTTLGAREATLQQLRATLPAGVRLTSY